MAIELDDKIKESLKKTSDVGLIAAASTLATGQAVDLGDFGDISKPFGLFLTIISLALKFFLAKQAKKDSF